MGRLSLVSGHIRNHYHYTYAEDIPHEAKRMKQFLAVLTLATILGCSNSSSVPQSAFAIPENGYDSILANRLGSDEYGMRQYVMALLKKGPNRDQDSTTAAQIQRAHLDNINRMATEGKLVLAGPFLDDGNVRGIYVFAVESVEEARRLTETDPAVQAGRLIMDLHSWYGSAALMKVNELHQQIAKEGI